MFATLIHRFQLLADGLENCRDLLGGLLLLGAAERIKVLDVKRAFRLRLQHGDLQQHGLQPLVAEGFVVLPIGQPLRELSRVDPALALTNALVPQRQREAKPKSPLGTQR